MIRLLSVFLIAIFSFTPLLAQETDDFWEGSNGPHSPEIYDFVKSNENEFIFATRKGLFKGDINGQIQKIDSEELTRDHYNVLFKDSEGTIWVGANHNNGGSGENVYKSEDSGATWAAVDLHNFMAVTDILEDKDGTLYLSSIYNRGIYKKDSESDTWVDLSGNMPSTGKSVLDLHLMDGVLLAGTQNGGYYSEDGGVEWTKAEIDIPDYQYVTSFTTLGDSVYASTSAGVFKSVDGKIFEKTAFTNNTKFVKAFNDELYVVERTEIKKSNDYFQSTSLVGGTIRAERLKIGDGKLYALTDELHELDEANNEWVEKIGFGHAGFRDFTLLPGGGITAIGGDGTIFYTKGWGESWMKINDNATEGNTLENAIAASQSGKIFVINASPRPDELAVTSDYQNWEKVELPDDVIPLQVQSDKNGVLYVLSSSSVMMSEDDGASWTVIMDYEDAYTYSFSIFEEEIFVSQDEGTILYSPDKGETIEEWISEDFDVFDGVTRLSDGRYLFVVNGSGVFETLDQGETFTVRNSGMLRTSTSKILAVNDTLYVPYANGVYVSVDSAQSWSNWRDGLITSDTFFRDIALNREDGRIYLLESVYGTYRTTLEFNIPISVEEQKALPKSITLGQNFPNPFNPNTTIPFEIDQAGYTTLEVFNVVGEHIQTLVSRNMNTGTHNIQFDASNLSSGIYFYRLTNNNATLTRKLTLIK